MEVPLLFDITETCLHDDAEMSIHNYTSYRCERTKKQKKRRGFTYKPNFL